MGETEQQSGPGTLAALSSNAAVMQPDTLDLTSCDREPIHIPGSIQPHGFLLALDGGHRIAIASANAMAALGRPHTEVFGRMMADVLGRSTGHKLLAELTAEPLGIASRLLSTVTLPQSEAGEPFQVIAFRSGSGFTVLEFERLLPAFGDAPGQDAASPEAAGLDITSAETINARLYNFVSRIRAESHAISGIEPVCRAAVEEVHALTGCDRVVLYRFNEEGHGLVLAETRTSDHFASYLGLRFPASDVPQQARRMYEINRVRIIPNVDYEPSPLLAAGGSPAPELDLSSSVLRSVSPIHRQYMRNMGTICSMSISILIDGRLWGLVSCHHHRPRYVPFRLRSACDFILQIVASQIESQGKSHRLQRALEARAVQRRLLAAMAGHDNYMEGLSASPEMLGELVRLVHADGVAIVAGLGAQLFGITPTEPQVLQLSEWLRGSGQDEVFATGSLSRLYPLAAGFAAAGSGVLAISVSKIHNTQLIWFRQELVETVRWAGNPAKPAEPAPNHATVDPRHSFEEWQQIVRGCSEPWSAQETEAAAEFRSAVLEIVLKRAEELAELAAGLQVANGELEAFSYSVSHDLRAPFRHISGFSEMLQEEEAERLSEQGRHYLGTIRESARFAGMLVDSLLEFSRFARSKVTLSPVDMEQLVDDEWAAVVSDEGAGRPIEFSRGPLPRVMGDPQLLRQVLRNLFSNAVKYTGRRPDPRARVQAVTSGNEFVFSVADNGVGFDQEYAGKLFGVFQRLHRIEEFEGTGIGLANVRRIVGRHGGRVWAEGETGKGATFYFTMPATFPPEEA